MIAEADGMRESFRLARREALWAIKALRDEPLELFAAATEREQRTIAEIQEPAVALRPMTSGSEVVEDYRHLGLTLRHHPLTFLREDLKRRRVVTCLEAMSARDGRWLTTAGLVLVRQKPGSAKGVMFITIEDETGIANLVIWTLLYERQRRIILGASMMAVQGRVQREGDVVHLVANQLTDTSVELAGVGERDDTAPEFILTDADGNSVSSRELLANGPLVITFYRGAWCPYCNFDLGALEESRPEIEARGASLVAISEQTAPNSRKSQRQNGLKFPILGDHGGEIAARFGVRWTLPDYLREVQKALGADLTQFNGEDSWTLPMPARYVIARDGTIAYAEVNADYTRRSEPSAIFPVLEQLRRHRAA
jgi:peroxiredoxin